MKKFGKWQGADFASIDVVKKHSVRGHEGSCNTYPAIDIAPGGVPVLYTPEENVIYCDDSDNHTLIVGETGCGKTRSIDAATILSSSASGASMIITDVKGELLKMTGKILQDKGYGVKVLDFRDPNSSPDGWNFLEGMKFYTEVNADKVSAIIDNFVYCLADEQLSSGNSDRFFANMAKQFVAGTLRALISVGKPEEIHIQSLISILTVHKHRLKEFFSRFQDNLPIYSTVSGCINTAPDTRMGILSSADNLIQPFVGRTALTDMISASTFKAADFLEKTALFMIFPEENKTLLRLIGFLIQQIYEELVYLAYSENDGYLRRRVLFLLDEFGNYELQNFTEMISCARARNIRLVLSIQNISQLARYGNDAMETILNNCPNQIYMASRAISTAEYLSKICGIQYRYCRGYREERSLVSPHDLQLLNKREALILRRGLSPYMTVLPDFSEIYPDKMQPIHLSPRKKNKLPIFNLEAFLDSSYDEAVGKMIIQLIDFAVMERSKETDTPPEVLINTLIKDIRKAYDLMSGFSGYLRKSGSKGNHSPINKTTVAPPSEKKAPDKNADPNNNS